MMLAKPAHLRSAFLLLFVTLGLGLGFVSLSPLSARSQASPEAARPISLAEKKSFAPASVRARPGLKCDLHPRSGGPGVPVFTDDDGYARFHALRAAANEANHLLTLDCTDSEGARSNYPVDLASEDTFVSRPLDLARERGADRPPLKGDPLSYSQVELIREGYGLRPDLKDSEAYLLWLSAASRPARMLHAKREVPHSHNVTSVQGPPWTGSVLNGVPNYISVQGAFTVPMGVPGGDQTTNTAIAIWNGLGGFNTSAGLIQGGVGVQTTPTTASYLSWREYCCGYANSNGYGGAFVPGPGDVIFAQNWYCDANGNLNLNGGYGCTFLHDLTTGAILNCTLANGSPCWSAPAPASCSVNCPILGVSAEFIIENQSPQMNAPSTAFTDFAPTVRMTGSAYSSQTGRYSQTINTDPSVYLLTDFTRNPDPTSLSVALSPPDATCFTVFPRGNPPPSATCPRFIPFVPHPSQIDPHRKDEIIALILYGVINDGGGRILINGHLKPVPPRGPVTEILAALPGGLAQKLEPLVKEYPADAAAANRMVENLTTEIGQFVQHELAGGKLP